MKSATYSFEIYRVRLELIYEENPDFSMDIGIRPIPNFARIATLLVRIGTITKSVRASMTAPLHRPVVVKFHRSRDNGEEKGSSFTLKRRQSSVIDKMVFQ